VFVASKEGAAKDTDSQDLVSLSYISNKTILVASRNEGSELLAGKTFNTGM